MSSADATPTERQLFGHPSRPDLPVHDRNVGTLLVLRDAGNPCVYLVNYFWFIPPSMV